MKRTITGILMSHAFYEVKEAKRAFDAKDRDWEVQRCVVAQLLMGLSLEGVANEIGEVVHRSKWKSLETNIATPDKWAHLSHQGGRKKFKPGKEPLKTVRRLRKIRDEVAYLKVHDLGDEIIMQAPDGKLIRNVPPTQFVRPTDQFVSIPVQLQEKFGYITITPSAPRAYHRTFYSFGLLQSRTTRRRRRWVTLLVPGHGSDFRRLLRR